MVLSAPSYGPRIPAEAISPTLSTQAIIKQAQISRVVVLVREAIERRAVRHLGHERKLHRLKPGPRIDAQVQAALRLRHHISRDQRHDALLADGFLLGYAGSPRAGRGSHQSSAPLRRGRSVRRAPPRPRHRDHRPIIAAVDVARGQPKLTRERLTGDAFAIDRERRWASGDSASMRSEPVICARRRCRGGCSPSPALPKWGTV